MFCRVLNLRDLASRKIHDSESVYSATQKALKCRTALKVIDSKSYFQI